MKDRALVGRDDTAKQNGFSITELAYLLNRTLEETFNRVQFFGELFEVKLWSSGHLYFTIKDEESQLRAVIWRSQFAKIKFKPQVGDKVVCFGRPNIWSKSGQLQIIVDEMRPIGEGELQKKFLELKAKLEKEGLFSESRKRKLPFFPQAIGVVTSEHGAVIHDIMARVVARLPSLKVFLVPVKVQGEGAADDIVRGIQLLNRHPLVEVIIVARGGGSLEDLWAFNEEKVVRAIFGSQKPVVSGVGHETDVTLADFAADLRAPTPTAAAELVVPDRGVLDERITGFRTRLGDRDRLLARFNQYLDLLHQRLISMFDRSLYQRQVRLNSLEVRLATLKPQLLLARLRERIFSARTKINRSLRALHRSLSINFARHKERLLRIKPSDKLLSSRALLLRLEDNLQASIKEKTLEFRNKIANLQNTLQNTNPQRTLARGYVIVKQGKEILSSVDKLKVGAEFEANFYDGFAISVVREINKG